MSLQNWLRLVAKTILKDLYNIQKWLVVNITCQMLCLFKCNYYEQLKMDYWIYKTCLFPHKYITLVVKLFL